MLSIVVLLKRSKWAAAIWARVGASIRDDRLLGGSAVGSPVFDNSKIKRFVPGWETTVPFAEVVARSLAWFEGDAARKEIDEEWSGKLDRIVEAYEAGWLHGN